MNIEQPYNPLDKGNLGVSVTDALLARPIVALPIEKAFSGAGIYALYYTGPFSAYVTVSDLTRSGALEMPLYVGKAVPSGARKGVGVFDASQGRALWKRLNEHAESIASASNLTLSDFRCRFLVVDDIWIPLGESVLVDRFRPVWNVVVEGFGNHDPGKGRYRQQRSAWDTLHPGRAWAMKCLASPKSATDIEESVRRFLSERDGQRQ